MQDIDLSEEELLEVSTRIMKHHFDGIDNAKHNPDLPVCTHCKHYVKSAFWVGDGKCSKDFPDELYEAKDYHTCEQFERGTPGQERIIETICGNCKHFYHDPDWKKEGCCMLYGKESANATYPRQHNYDASKCTHFEPGDHKEKDAESKDA